MKNPLNKGALFKTILFPIVLGIVFSQNLFANGTRKKIPLSMRKAIELTLQNNLDIAVERINPLIDKKNITIEKAFFDPGLFADLSFAKEVTPSASAFSSPDVTSLKNQNFAIGIKQILKTGGSYEVKLESIRSTTNSDNAGLNPQFSSFIEMDFTQPLLKDFGINLNTRKIIIAKNNQNISQTEFKNIVMQSISEVKNNYWDIVFKRDDLQVKKQSLDLAKDLENRVKIQVEVGVLAPIEILQAQAEVAVREEEVIITENEIKDLEDQLKTKLNFSPEAEEWDLNLELTDSPSFATEKFHLDNFLKIALEKRPEIENSKIDLANKKIDVLFKKNQRYPSINLVGNLGLNGISGDAIPTTIFSGGTSTTRNSRFGGSYGRSLDRTLSGDFYSYDIGLKLQYPFGNRAAKRSHSVSKLEVKKTLIGMKSIERQIKLEVKEAIRAIQTNVKRVKVTNVSKILAEEKLRAEEKKFEVGLSTSFQVLEFQKDLVDAQSKKIKAIIDYNKSIVQLYKVAGITLEKNNVRLH